MDISETATPESSPDRRAKRPIDAVSVPVRQHKRIKTGNELPGAPEPSNARLRDDAQPHEVDVTLRDLPLAPRTFWKASMAEQAICVFWDKNLNGLDRRMPDNEVAAMALNEIAAHHGYGYFFFLPSRQYWTMSEYKALLPPGRVPDRPGASYPTLLYTEHAWSPSLREAFYAASHRARYLASNALINPPENDTPVYAIQYIGYAKCELYKTTIPSLTVLATTEEYYVLSTTQLESIVGRWSRAYRPRGPDPESRLQSLPYLWNAGIATTQERLKLNSLRQFRHDNLEAVYTSIRQQCQAYVGSVAATFSGETLQEILPSGNDPVCGSSLGLNTIDGESVRSAWAPSRKGERHQRRTAAEAGADTLEDSGARAESELPETKGDDVDRVRNNLSAQMP